MYRVISCNKIYNKIIWVEKLSENIDVDIKFYTLKLLSIFISCL